MKVPSSMTEDEVLSIIERIARSLAPKFKFGYNDLDDMKQYATMFGIQGLDKHDPEKGTLETFLWTHIRNRLFNLKRDNYERPDKPCFHCGLNAYDPNYLCSQSQCTEHNDKMMCALYYKWYNRNSKKRNIISPIGLGNVRDETEDNMKVLIDISEEVEFNGIIEAIDQELPINLRPLWVKFRNDISLNKGDREKLFPVVKTILEREGINGS